MPRTEPNFFFEVKPRGSGWVGESERVTLDITTDGRMIDFRYYCGEKIGRDTAEEELKVELNNFAGQGIK